MAIRKYILFLLISTIAFSCTVQKKYQNIRTIAVLPVEVELTGHLPKDVSKEKEALSKSINYQKKIYDLLRDYSRSSKKVQVKFLDIDSVSYILSKNNIDNHTLLFKTPGEIEKILGVDAVVKTYVKENHIMGDGLSMGISAFKRGVSLIKKVPYSSLSGLSEKTGSLQVSCGLISKGYTLWNRSFLEDTKWNRQPEDAFDKIAYNLYRQFPVH